MEENIVIVVLLTDIVNLYHITAYLFIFFCTLYRKALLQAGNNVVPPLNCHGESVPLHPLYQGDDLRVSHKSDEGSVNRYEHISSL